jgi:hypothetical protein
MMAQSEVQKRYDREAIYLRPHLWSGQHFVKYGKSKPVGFLFNNIKPEFEHSDALPLFLKARRKAKISFGVSLLGLATSVTGLVMISNAHTDNRVRNENQFAAGVGLIMCGTLISAAVTLPLNIGAQRNLSDAVFLRNRELLK